MSSAPFPRSLRVLSSASLRQAINDTTIAERRRALLLAAEPFTSSTNATFVPWLARDGLLNGHTTDTANLALSERALALYTALLTGLILLLLSDIVFRAVTRTPPRPAVCARAIARHSLLSRASNPLYWLSLLRAPGSRRAGGGGDVESSCNSDVSEGGGGECRTVAPARRDDVSEDDEPRKAAVGALPKTHAVFVVCVGVALTLVQLVLILTSANRLEVVELARAKMPALVPRSTIDATFSRVPDANNPHCASHALVDRPGFSSEAEMRVCASREQKAYYFDDQDMGDMAGIPVDTIMLRFRMVGGTGLSIDTFKWIDSDNAVYSRGLMSVDIITPDAAIYRSGVQAGLDETLAVVRAELVGRGLQPQFVSKTNDSSFVPHPNWEIHLQIPVSSPSEKAAVGLPRNYVEAIAMNSVLQEEVTVEMFHGHAWTDYISSICIDLMEVKPDIGRATRDSFHGARLEDYTGPLVLKRRPWLGLLPCIVITAVVSIFWLFVVVIKGWRAGIDYSLI